MQSKLEKKKIKNKLQGLTNYKKYNKVSRFTVTVRFNKKAYAQKKKKNGHNWPFSFRVVRGWGSPNYFPITFFFKFPGKQRTNSEG